jgi:hypothetical protein
MTDTTPPPARKYGHGLTLSAKEIDEANRHAAAIGRYLDATPEQRQQWARESAARRADQRAAAPPVELTLDTLIAALNITPQYARHLVQPYCGCSVAEDLCAHATDQGLTS